MLIYDENQVKAMLETAMNEVYRIVFKTGHIDREEIEMIIKAVIGE